MWGDLLHLPSHRGLGVRPHYPTLLAPYPDRVMPSTTPLTPIPYYIPPQHLATKNFLVLQVQHWYPCARFVTHLPWKYLLHLTYQKIPKMFKQKTMLQTTNATLGSPIRRFDTLKQPECFTKYLVFPQSMNKLTLSEPVKNVNLTGWMM